MFKVNLAQQASCSSSLPINTTSNTKSETEGVKQDYLQPNLTDEKAVNPLLQAVVQGKPVALSLFIRNDRQALLNYAQKDLNRFLQLIRSYSAEITQFKNSEIDINQLVQCIIIGPELLFKKGQIKDPAGQVFYDVSPYQLMTFLCDEDMKQRIMQLMQPMTETMEAEHKRQYAEIDCGGPDLVKMDRDPLTLPFNQIIQYITSYQVSCFIPFGKRTDSTKAWSNTTSQVTFPLLENPDGIIYFKDTTGQAHFYYANQAKQTVEEVHPASHSAALCALIDSFDGMENNSSRRSNNEEHQLIAQTMQCQLHRKGIQYDDHRGVRFCDSRAQFYQYFNAYRKCIRLSDKTQYEERSVAWRINVGLAQRNVIWILQRICEERSFAPPFDFKNLPFERGFKLCEPILEQQYSDSSSSHVNTYNFRTYDSLVHPDGRLIDELGRDFGITRAEKFGYQRAAVERMDSECSSLRTVLVALCKLIESAKANVIEFTEEHELQPQDIALPRL